MNEGNYYWLLLVKYWVNKKKKNGLTIPFILGTQTINNPNNHLNKSSIKQLFTEIINSDINEIMVLEYCPDIGEYVLGLENKLVPKEGNKFNCPRNNSTRIIATFNTEVLGKNLDDIIMCLEKKYMNCINDEHFSMINNKWAKYCEDDKETIEKALSYKSKM